MRNEIISDWLARTEWSAWRREPMTGDASARRYELLCSSSGTTVILMDAPPEICGSQSRFVAIAKHLSGLGLAAPNVLEWDDALGLMVLDDLGKVDFTTHLRGSPNEERHLYEAAVDTLLVLQSAPPPAGLSAMTPDVGANMLDLAFEWAATDQSPDLHVEIKTRVKSLLAELDPDPPVLSLRDFHAENLIWRPKLDASQRVGLLDFQDAFITHPTYDLVSLLRDARRDVDPNLLDPLLDRLTPDSVGREIQLAAFHVMAVQRNLRILGIFCRLAKRDGKTGYLKFLPRVIGHLRTDLRAPICADLAPLVGRAFVELDL
jgi:aminoglycoside/choline kinase family phosphotransferase